MVARFPSSSLPLREWRAAGEFQLIFVPCLATRELVIPLDIAKAKLNLETWAVCAQHILTPTWMSLWRRHAESSCLTCWCSSGQWLYSQQPAHAQTTLRMGKVEPNPVDALSSHAVEIHHVGPLAMGVATLHLSEIYLFLSPYTKRVFPRVGSQKFRLISQMSFWWHLRRFPYFGWVVLISFTWCLFHNKITDNQPHGQTLLVVYS